MATTISLRSFIWRLNGTTRALASRTCSRAPRFQALSTLTEPVFEPPKPVVTENKYTVPDTYSFTRLPPHKAFTLIPESYSDEAFYKTEQKMVWSKSWVCVGTLDKLKEQGDTITADVGNVPIFVTRNKSGALRAFQNVCRHRGAKLVREDGRYPVISCPYHRWGYSHDGKLLGTPLWNTVEGGDRVDVKTGERTSGLRSKSDRRRKEEKKQKTCIEKAFETSHLDGFDKKDYGLFEARVETLGCMVFVCLSNETPSLRYCLGDAVEQLHNYPLADLVTVRAQNYDSAANWKLLAENFMEYYHLPSVHPSLCAVSAVDDHIRLQGRGQYVGFATRPLTNGGTPIDPNIFPAFEGLNVEENNTGLFHMLFPNVFYFLWPSHIFLVQLHPVSPTQTLEKASLLVHPSLLEKADREGTRDELEKKLDAAMAFYDMTNKEDIDICEQVQIGLRSPTYQGGRVSFRFEETIHRFQNILIDYMCGSSEKVPFGDNEIPFYTGTPGEYYTPPPLVETVSPAP